MSIGKIRSLKAAIAAALVVGVLATAALPAVASERPAKPVIELNGAMASPALISVGTANNGDYSVSGQCSAIIGAATGFNSVTYAADGVSAASSTNGSVGIGTTVSCRVYDVDTGETYGSWAGGLPGPQAVAADTVVVPLSANVAVEWCGSALFNDGGGVSDCA